MVIYQSDQIQLLKIYEQIKQKLEVMSATGQRERRRGRKILAVREGKRSPGGRRDSDLQVRVCAARSECAASGVRYFDGIGQALGCQEEC